MTDRPIDSRPPAARRVEQARLEVGRTEVSRPVAWVLVALTALMVAAPPLAQTVVDIAAGRGPLPALAPLAAALADLPRAAGPVAANRGLLAAIEAGEERLEDESWLRSRLLPPTQRLLTGTLGLGNEQVVAGLDGWWYLAADFTHTTGRGFLEPAVARRRQRDEAVAADPLPALVALAGDLERRGVELLVVPVPPKTAIVPRPLTGRDTPPPVHNPSYGPLLARLAAAGVRAYDPTPDLLAAEAAGGDAFLRTDTHWTPAAIDRVAAAIAERLRALGVGGRGGDYYRRRATVAGRGDLTALLALPPGAAALVPESVAVDVVSTAEGEPWRPRADAEVLLLGDSYANVFSQPELGWGAGAGLGEQLSFHLGAAVDRIARNAGGADRTRAELAAELDAARAAGSRDRLGGKRAVVYQFAARELSAGDWRVIPLPPPASGGGL